MMSLSQPDASKQRSKSGEAENYEEETQLAVYLGWVKGDIELPGGSNPANVINF